MEKVKQTIELTYPEENMFITIKFYDYKELYHIGVQVLFGYLNKSCSDMEMITFKHYEYKDLGLAKDKFLKAIEDWRI